MAIIIEEEKNRSNISAVVGWIVILGIILIAIYYVFFTVPEATVTVPPSGFQNITPIAQINFNPDSVINDPTFQSLKQYVEEPGTSTIPVGRSNPFVSP